MTKVKNKWLQHAILLSAPLLSVIDVFIVNISTPSIQSDLKATNAQIELVIAAYLIGLAGFIITGGRVGDYLGRKKTFLFGMFAFVITSCICGMATSPFMLISARFFQGVAAAFMLPQSLSYLQFLFTDKKERTKAIGWVGFTLGTASVLGQFLGGYLSSLHTAIAGWRFIFYINLPIGLMALFLASKFLVEYKGDHANKGFDVWGVVLVVFTLCGLIYPLSEGRELGWPWWSIVLMLVALLCFFLLLKWQRKRVSTGKFALIPLDLFQIRSFNLGITAAVFYFMMHTSYLLISTIYVQKGLGKSPYDTGLYFVVFGLGFTLSALMSIKLVHKYGVKAVIGGILLLIGAYILQFSYFNSTVTSTSLSTILLITGLAGGMVLPTLINLSLREVPTSLSGVASGVYNTSQQSASSLGICIVSGLFFYSAKLDGIVLAFHCTLIAEIILAVFVLIMLLFIQSHEKKKARAVV